MAKEGTATNVVNLPLSKSPIAYRIDPEVAHTLISSDDPDIASRHAEFWDRVGPEYADIARNLGSKVAMIRVEKGDSAADSYLEAATTILEAMSQQDELDRRLAQ